MNIYWVHFYTKLILLITRSIHYHKEIRTLWFMRSLSHFHKSLSNRSLQHSHIHNIWLGIGYGSSNSTLDHLRFLIYVNDISYVKWNSLNKLFIYGTVIFYSNTYTNVVSIEGESTIKVVLFCCKHMPIEIWTYYISWTTQRSFIVHLCLKVIAVTPLLTWINCNSSMDKLFSRRYRVCE